MQHINKFHVDGLDWYIFVYCYVVDPYNSIALFLNAMNDVNWYMFFTCLCHYCIDHIIYIYHSFLYVFF